ncbi:glycosyltransferase family 4 protein [Inmirania thermothiophila]|uniref:Glycosyltransferase involved in cell wall biosynthesis n=1 Tax=Inmirania thermothiophila TaxID=1750597 RepID=A0A3N1Y8R4_9GAMM|nr:glycosyltransferase family 4 protein [Inmirania thermothiophila]ROR35150.1 glycosyltransferase involved in cell wall biosynthesis [Inmirania thermothiophila]
MRILLIHNRYTQPGGEDAVFEAERALLERMGHRVVTFVEDNARLDGVNPLKAAVEAVWSRETQRRLKRLIEKTRPDVVHFHNTFLRISPAAYYTVKAMGLPVVQTLHNYRLVCPGALLMRDGRVCETCVGRKVPWPGAVHGCWRGSRAQTAVVAAMVAVHRALGTWERKVDRYIALTEVARRRFAEGGVPADRIAVKPNFVDPDPGAGAHDGGYALFVGRLSAEKGVRTLLEAWKGLRGIPLRVVGDGPLRGEMEERARDGGVEVEFMGRRGREEVLRLMKDARVLVFPSVWYEGFPVTLAEAFACGLPVVASRLGAMAEIVEDGRTGLLFKPGDAQGLAETVAALWGDRRRCEEMGREARSAYLARYTADANYERLMAIYRQAIAEARA